MRLNVFLSVFHSESFQRFFKVLKSFAAKLSVLDRRNNLIIRTLKPVFLDKRLEKAITNFGESRQKNWSANHSIGVLGWLIQQLMIWSQFCVEMNFSDFSEYFNVL